VELHQHRNRGCHHISGVRSDQQVNFVDLDELRVEPRNVRGIALVVIEHKLDRPTEQTAFGIRVVAPNLQRAQHLFTDRRYGASERHTQADADRIVGFRRLRQDQRGGNEERSERPAQ